MSAALSSQKIGVFCDVTLFLVLILSGLGTALMWYNLFTPVEDGFRLDLVDEIDKAAIVLNIALPLGVVCLLASTLAKVSAGRLEPYSTAIVFAGSIGVFAWDIAMYAAFVDMHADFHLWSKIWWRFGV